MRKTACSLFTVLALLASVAAAEASTITYNFTASLQFASDLGNLGDPVTGTIKWDTAVVDVNPDPQWGTYPGSGLSMSFTVGGNTYTATNGDLNVFNDFVNGSEIVDSFLMHFNSLSGPGAYNGGSADFQMAHVDLSPPVVIQTPFNSDAIPASLNLADFPQTSSPNSGHPQVFIRQSNNANPGVITLGTLESLTLVQDDTAPDAVPEPATLSLLGLGVGIGAAASLRRRLRKP